MSEQEIEKYHFLKDEPQKRQFDIYDLAEYQKTNSQHSSKPHTHSFYQIIWFKSNKGKHFIDFEEYDIKKNRIFFIAKNQVHFFEKRQDYSGLLFHFNESFILNNETDINFFLTYSIFNNHQEPFYQVPNEQEHQILSYFQQIENETKNNGEFGNQMILSNVLKAFLLRIEREKRKNGKTIKTDLSRNFTYLKFRDLLEHNFYQNWSVSNYADQLSISTKTLNSIIKSEMGKTTSQVIADRILLEAKRKLIHTNARINQIGYDLGFQDPYYFIKYFKKHLKISPSEFRKTIS
ncbi:AraC-like DNA-binding protein [Aquimarina sp. EL_43]|uniref:AraC family transcriptional regulator n=1 Tax=unclassified Aquimarina TaxID=2627091 RepID=UPI0018CB8FAD|nr:MULTISPECIES: AraC family transcriptional regulator [unclassified Aquimarina]MBG6131146.1 AraC-like DNA-binding protein [Aquimarina sp. EL_35]MBG6151605.1 AraC-like DNA-binding protein [Aquimarina sp. EL_32]MBG6169536.1 AraC-like DNA-binding protein [Aquimarina sp. EL_43]